MGLGSGKKSSGKKDKKSKKSSQYRTIGSIWKNEIETRDGEEKEVLNFNVDNPDPEDKYHQGTLIWKDAETGKLFRVKSMNVFPADKGPDNLLNKLSIKLDNEYHVEELD